MKKPVPKIAPENWEQTVEVVRIVLSLGKRVRDKWSTEEAAFLLKRLGMQKRTRKRAVTKRLAGLDSYLAADNARRMAEAQRLVDKMTPRQLAAAKRKYGVSP